MAWPENVRKTDLDISYYRGSGPGGQHRNKRDTACRIKHIPTGISACAEDCKSQRQNRSKAFRKLAKQLVPLMVPKIEVEKSNERIRTYHEPRQQVKDDRIKDETWSFDDVVYGKGLGKIIRKLNGI
jgi:peptide chain release factor 1